MSEKFLLTAALPYANGPLHFGHIAGAYLPADCFARFQRLLQNDVLYICGSDEYGVAITMSAEKENRSPKEHVDIFHDINKKFFEKLQISFDHYSRTTWEGHIPVAQQFFLDLYNNGYIEEKTEDHLFSPEENKFLADRYVMGTCPKCGFEGARGDECQSCGASYEATDLINPKSKMGGGKLILKPSKHWYLRFDKFKDELLAWIEKKNWKKNVLNMAKEYIKDLKPRAITRDSIWGVPVPLDNAEGKVLYVWFDAPIGYISATKELSKIKNDEKLWEKYWFDPKTKLIHFIGKDNIPFHSVFFPAMIMGQNSPFILPYDVPANEFLLFEGKQFSKSDNWYIDLDDFFKKYSVDQIRYYLAANAPESSDAEFTYNDFKLRCNSELLSKFGNFINRVLVFTANKLGGKVFKLEDIKPEDKGFIDSIKDKVSEAKKAYSNYHLRKASQIIMELAQIGNVYFDHKKPWALIKDPTKEKDLNNTLAACLQCIKALALISYPIIPNAAEKIWGFLGYKDSLLSHSWEDISNESIPLDHKIEKPNVLFEKIEDETIEKDLEKLKSK